MKTLFILIFMAFIAIPSLIYAQTTDCDQLRSEVEYLKKALKMQSNPVYTDVIGGVEIKILSIVGSKRSKTFQIEAIATSKGKDNQGWFTGNTDGNPPQEAVDPEGNKYNAFGDPAIKDYYADIPFRSTIVFTNVEPSIPVMRLVRLVFGTVATGNRVLEYRNVKIDWQYLLKTQHKSMKRLGILLFWWASWLSSEAQNCPELNELKTALNMKDRPFETTDVLQGVQMRFLNCAFVPQSQAIKFEFSFTGTNTKDTDISVREFRAIDMEGNVYEAGNFQFYNNTNHLSKGIVQKAFGEFNNVPRSVRYFKLLKFNFSANDHTYTMQYKDVRISYPDEPKRVVATANESTKHKELIGTWEGRYYQHGGASYEATLIIKSITGNEFEGKMEWLGGHVVIENDNKVYGKIDGSTVTWVVPEGTVVADMILGGKYVANWTGASLKGKMFGEDKNERGTFSFNNKNYGASNLPSNKINQPLINTSTTSAWLGLWSGQIDSPMLLSLYLNVEQIAGTTFNGYYYHQPPTMPGDKGRPASGTINGNKIRFLIEQNWFEGTLSGNKIAGRGDLRSKNDAVFWLKKGGSTETANSYEYRGRIVDKKTKTVPSGVVVYYEDLATGENLGQTDVNTQTGEYVLTLPYGKRYGITAKAQGFVASSVSVDLVKPNAKPVLKNTDLYVVPIEAGASINLNNIFFNAGKSNLLPESFAELNRIADFLTENKNIVVEIGGHTDNIGNDQANLTLSQDRADAVSFYLLSKGIQAARLRAKGYGKNRPLAANATEDGKAQNRRVEFVIVKK